MYSRHYWKEIAGAEVSALDGNGYVEASISDTKNAVKYLVI